MLWRCSKLHTRLSCCSTETCQFRHVKTSEVVHTSKLVTHIYAWNLRLGSGLQTLDEASSDKGRMGLVVHEVVQDGIHLMHGVADLGRW